MKCIKFQAKLIEVERYTLVFQIDLTLCELYVSTIRKVGIYQREVIESVYRRRTDNTMAKRKRTNNDLQNIHIKLKIE